MKNIRELLTDQYSTDLLRSAKINSDLPNCKKIHKSRRKRSDREQQHKQQQQYGRRAEPKRLRQTRGISVRKISSQCCCTWGRLRNSLRLQLAGTVAVVKLKGRSANRTSNIARIEHRTSIGRKELGRQQGP